MVSFRRSAAQLNAPSTLMMLGGPPMDISPDISPPLQSRNFSRKIANSFQEIIDFRNRKYISSIALWSNPIIAANAKEFAAFMKLFINLSDYVPELGQDDCWFFFSILVLLLRGGSREENMIKMPVFPLMQHAHNFEENWKFIFLKNVKTNVF